MIKKESEILTERIKKWYTYLPKLFVNDERIFTAKYGWSKDKTSFENRLKLNYKDIKEGDDWGKKWESAWFELSIKIPSDWKGKTLATNLDFSGEGLVFDSKGNEIQGITNGAIWDPNFARTRVIINQKLILNQTLTLWVEAAANSLFGVFTDPDVKEESPKKHGWFDAKVEKMRLGIFDVELWNLYLDARVLMGLLKHLDKDSVQRERIILALNNAINAFRGSEKRSKAARACLKSELKKSASASDLKVSAVGHAHIDTGWLWPVKETIRKCARTFSTQLEIIEKYPDYIFGASQPQHYQFIKDYYPQIYKGIKKAVKKGQWELQGGMWVEADCNLISGESMVRQLIHGKNFFMDEFGVEVDNLWLPDVFGYSAALPQILKKSGVNYFLTQKLSWSQYNEFPHHTFNWRGIDGSEVLTHFPPENTYNSELDTEFLIPAQKHFKEKAYLDEFISLFGVGNGGGGPKPENIELGHRMSNLESSPKVKFDLARNFFKRLDKNKESLETWVGELYLELHRGTLTTHGLVKKQNRKLEIKLRNVEMFWSCLDIDLYPSKELDALWKKLLINQFHDIIPGSSINLVYKTTHQEYDQVHKGCDDLIKRASKRLFSNSSDSFVLANTLSDSWQGVVDIPNSFKNYDVLDEKGNKIPIQLKDDSVIGFVDLPALSFSSFTKGEKVERGVKTGNNLVLENDLVSYKFNDNGRLIKCFDKELNQDFLIGEGNIFSLYEDIPNNWDAWDIDFFYRDALLETAKVFDIVVGVKCPFYQELTINFIIGKSRITQIVSLNSVSKRLDFKTKVNWVEKHKMLRVHFPLNIKSDQASFDIQYGYVKRNTHQNTSWDKAKFEVVGHKYADLSDNDCGVALLNDCKYGYMVNDNILDLNLLRSPNNPDPDADMEEHDFTYSLLPHKNSLINSNVITESSCLNNKPLLFDKFKAQKKIPLLIKGLGLELSVLKKAEKKDYLIFRIIERLGRKSEGEVYLQGEITEYDLIEWNKIGEKIKVEEKIKLQFKPFEIKTFLLKRN